VTWVKNLRTLEATQIAYMDAVETSGLGASRFLPGEVFDEAGQHVARISYNGRLWEPETWTPEMKSIAEAPRASAAFSLFLDDGKYEVVRTAAGEAYANRHGERWRDLHDAPLILRLAREVHDAREAIAERGGDPMTPGETPAFYGRERDMLRLTLNDDTEIVQTAEGRVRATRNGEPVDIEVGDKLLLGLAYELEGARASLAVLEPVADAPLDDSLVWMVGTRESVMEDAFTAGPDNAFELLALNMVEDEILIGKDRSGAVRVVREKTADGLMDIPDGLDGLRERGTGNDDEPGM
jgi:hypothetical protein